jgi:hypothetical protein
LVIREVDGAVMASMKLKGEEKNGYQIGVKQAKV